MSELRAIPQNPILGLLARVLAKAQGGLDALLPPGEKTLGFENETIQGLTPVPGARKVIEDASYGFAPTKGSGFATKVDPAVLDVVDVTKFAGKAARNLAKTLAKNVDDLPVQKIFAGPMAQDPPTKTYAQARKEAPRRSWFDDATGVYQPAAGHGDVFKRTGWYMDPAGDWKWEIDDSVSRMAPGFNVDTRGNPLYAGMAPLSTIFEHDELFRQYPELKDFPVRWTMGSSNSGAAHSNFLDVRGTDEQKLKQILLHEIQHWVQNKEGHARGANPDAFAEQILKKHPDMLKNLGPAALERESNLSYMNKLGEIESRATEMRMNLPFMDRQNKAPWRNYSTYSPKPGTMDAIERDLMPQFGKILTRGGLDSDPLRQHSARLDEIDDLIATHGTSSWKLLDDGEPVKELYSPSFSIANKGRVETNFLEGAEDVVFVPRQGAFDPRYDRTSLFNRDAWTARLDDHLGYLTNEPKHRLADKESFPIKFSSGEAAEGWTDMSQQAAIHTSPSFRSFKEYEKSPRGAKLLVDDYEPVNKYEKDFNALVERTGIVDRYDLNNWRELNSIAREVANPDDLKTLDDLAALARRAPSTYAELKASGPVPISPERFAGAIYARGSGDGLRDKEMIRLLESLGLRVPVLGKWSNKDLFEAAMELQRSAKPYGKKAL